MCLREITAALLDCETVMLSFTGHCVDTLLVKCFDHCKMIASTSLHVCPCEF